MTVERLWTLGRQTHLAAVLCRCEAQERTRALRTSAQRLFPGMVLQTTVGVVGSVASSREAYEAVWEEWLATTRDQGEE